MVPAGKRPGSCITHGHRDVRASVIAYRNRGGDTCQLPESDADAERSRQTGEEIVGVDRLPGQTPRSVKVSAGGSGDAHRGGSESFYEEGEDIKCGERLLRQVGSIGSSLSVKLALPLIWNASINKVPSAARTALLSGFSAVEEDAERGERSTQSHFSGRKRGRVFYPSSPGSSNNRFSLL